MSGESLEAPALYRLSWDMVSVQFLHFYCDADPRYYSNTRQVVVNSEIPDEHWHRIWKETDDPWQQYYKLKEWADSDKEFIRDVLLEKQVSEPRWAPIDEVA